MSKTKRWLAIIGVLFLVLIVAGLVALPSLEPKLEKEMVRAIEKQFEGNTEVESLQLSLFPRIRANGKKLVLWYKGRRDLPPLISIEEFSVDSGWMGLLHSPVEVHRVTLTGLVIQIPPKGEKSADQAKQNLQLAEKPDKKQNSAPVSPAQIKQPVPPFIIDSILADGAILKILPKQIDKDPLVFELYKMSLQSADITGSMHYEATLKNATPPGLIDAKGEFGPWQKDDPGSTPVSGKYTFQKADLSVFKGISGTLFSIGDFKGVLERIDAKGTTDTPDFMVRTGSQPVHLKTQFHAVIDGTSGDTLLQPVKARFGRTEITCNGGVTKQEGNKGKSIILDVKMEKGRIEDLLKLAVPSKPFMIGTIRFNAKFDLPPGDKDVVEKLNLDGTFTVENAQFTTSTVQDQIEKLSLRSRGIHDDSTSERIVSDLKGDFLLSKGTISFSKLSFSVPGAQVNLDGDYGLVTQEIDFQGKLQMQAKLSQTQTGIKSVLLKAVDPFFKKGTSGAVIPIKIGGTFKDPSFGLNLHGSDKKSK